MFFASLLFLRKTSVGPHDCDSARPNGFVGLPAIHDEPTLHIELTGAAPARCWGNSGDQRALYAPCRIGPANGARGLIRQSHVVDSPELALIIEIASITGEVGPHPASAPCDRRPFPLAGSSDGQGLLFAIGGESIGVIIALIGRISRRTRQKTAECGH